MFTWYTSHLTDLDSIVYGYTYILTFIKKFNKIVVVGSFSRSPSVIYWFHSYFYGLRQRLQVQDTFLDCANVIAGVPQDSVSYFLRLSIQLLKNCLLSTTCIQIISEYMYTPIQSWSIYPLV